MNVTRIVLALIVAAVVVAMLRNPSGTVGIILAGGSASQGVLGTLSGQPSSLKGNFSTGTTKIAFS